MVGQGVEEMWPFYFVGPVQENPLTFIYIEIQLKFN
jgi:hypothetical protein